MGDIEFVILLLAAAAVCVRLAEFIHVPFPIVLVLGGLAIGLTPGLPDLELDPDIVFLVFLPPLLFSAAWYASPQELAAEARPLALLAVGLVLATMAAVAVRMAWMLIPFSGFGETARERVIVGWAGMRGAISLAAALAVPTSVPERPEILLLTFGVIAVTLLGQGLTLGPLLKKLRLPGPNRWSPDEAQVRLETAQAALDRLEELEEDGASEEPLRRLRDLYRTRFAVCVAQLGGGDLPEDGREELRSYGSMRRELIGVERATLLRLRSERTVGVDTIRRVERDLDLEEARLRR